jgi:hemerythrin-like domain-containing protein
LVEARDLYAAGETSAFADIAACLHLFVEFYPKHIAKEEQELFPHVTHYFTAAELSMLRAEQNEFDRRLMQVLYGKAVEAWERLPDKEGSDDAAAGPPM